jgi:hypothetical protein
MANAYANARVRQPNVILDPVTYWRVSAIALTAVALLGFVVNLFAGNGEGIPSFLEFDYTHNIVHVVLAGAAFVFGFGVTPSNLTKVFAIVFGFVYAGLGVFGFIAPAGLDFLHLHLEVGENLVHLALGAYALVAGFTARY